MHATGRRMHMIEKRISKAKAQKYERRMKREMKAQLAKEERRLQMLKVKEEAESALEKALAADLQGKERKDAADALKAREEQDRFRLDVFLLCCSDFCFLEFDPVIFGLDGIWLW